MAGINFIGSYSGIDQSSIEKLMQAERLPLNQLTSKKTNITSQQNAWKDVNTRLTSLFNRLEDLKKAETFDSKTAKSTNEEIISATASKDAIAGRYKIVVNSLATSARVEGNQIKNGEELVKLDEDLNLSGKLTINRGTNDTGEDIELKTISVESGDSLRDIINKINDKTKNTGVSGTIINNQIVLTDSKTGDRSILLESENNDLIDGLGLGTGAKYEPGTDAKFSVNGIDMTSESNTVKDAVLGLTINLKKDGDDPLTETITVEPDTGKLTKAIQDFVNQYNSTMTFIEEQLSAGTVSAGGDGSYSTTGRGTLAGDSSLQNLHSSLRKMVTDVLNVEGSDIKSMTQLGVNTIDGKSSKLQFDSSKLLEEFSKNPEGIMNFFNKKVGDTDTGFISKLNSKIDGYISSKDGVIKNKNESFDRSLKDLNKRIEAFNIRMDKKEQYYTKMFAALDVAMMKAESQMEWLQGQITAMNAQAGANKR